MAKYLHILFLLIALKKTPCFPTLRCTYGEKCHCPELISIMFSLDLFKTYIKSWSNHISDKIN